MNKERNCYSCEGFGHLTQNCKKWRIMGQERKMKYKNNVNSNQNLNGEENLIVLD